MRPTVKALVVPRRRATRRQLVAAKLVCLRVNDGAPRFCTAEGHSPADRESAGVPDGHAVAFIAGLMSDFNSTAETSTRCRSRADSNQHDPRHARIRNSLGWSCSGTVRAQLLAVDQPRCRIPMPGARPPRTRLVSGAKTLRWHDAGVCRPVRRRDCRCARILHSTPEIETGTIGTADLTAVNAGLSVPMRVQSLS